MNMKKTLLVLLTTSTLMPLAFAQNNAANAKPKIESKGTMTRDELRVCMALPDKIKAKSQELERAKATLDSERKTIGDAQSEMDALRRDVDTQKAEVQKTDTAVREIAAEIEAWNKELEDAEASSMKSAERRKKELKSQQPALVARNKATIASRDESFRLYGVAVEKYNTRGKELDGSIQAWNKRNSELASESDRLSDLREDYAADCSHRKFRETDEIAIKQGK